MAPQEGTALSVVVTANLADLRAKMAESEAIIGTTAKALSNMANAYDGTRTIANANAAMLQVQALGGATKLTETEQASLNRTLVEALEKYAALGHTAPPGMRALAAATKDAGDRATEARAGVGGLGQSLGEFDKVLAVMGIHIGPEVRALKEFGESADKSASQLGLITTAGLAVAAGIGGWKLGRAIADFFDLDKTIGDATAKLLGFGDVAAEVAAGQADVLARASKTMGYEVHNLSDAIEINIAAQKDFRTHAAQSAAAVAGWRSEIAGLTEKGSLPDLTAELAAQILPVKDLAAAYGVSVQALEQFQRDQKAAAQADEDTSVTIRRHNAEKLRDLGAQIEADQRLAVVHAATVLAVTKLDDEYNANRVSHSGTANEAAIAQIERWAADTIAAAQRAGIATKGFYESLARDAKEKLEEVGVDWSLWKTRSISALQETAENALKTYEAMVASGDFFRSDLEKQLETYHRLSDAAHNWGQEGTAAAEKVAAAQAKTTEELKHTLAVAKALRELGSSFTYDLSTDEGIDQYKKMNPAAVITWSNAQIEAYIAKGGTLQGLIASGVINPYAGMGRADGGPVDAGKPYLVGERGQPEWFVPATSGVVVPTSVGGMGGTQVIQLMVDGRVLASVVNDANTKTMRQARQWPTN